MVNIEYETKVLNINPFEVISKLRGLNAQETPEYLEYRMLFDMQTEGTKWVRVRKENGKCKMTYKYKPPNDESVGSTTEIEVEVSDFKKTTEILEKLGFFYRSMYQEKKIHIFHYNDIEFSLCTWPKLETYLEIESNSKEKVNEGLALLGLQGKDVGDYDIAKLYAAKGIDMNASERLSFSA